MLYRSLVIVLATVALSVAAARADMGRVIVNQSDVGLSEDAQKAVILHNGLEEVLILATELKAKAKTPIIRFLPFPSEPTVQPVPAGAFDRLGEVTTKYGLVFQSRWMTKGGAGSRDDGVQVLSSRTLGAHDLTVVRVGDAAKFRGWVNDWFRRKGLRTAASYPVEEAIVADYVARGIDYFVLDYVEVPADKRLVEPVAYRFASKDLYYPLKTSNSFGGNGEIDLFVVAPVTLCRPGSNNTLNYFKGENFDMAVANGSASPRQCLDVPVKASTSARLVPEEQDLAGIYPDWEAFFAGRQAFIQAMRYNGSYHFEHDIIVPLAGVSRAIGRNEAAASNGPSRPRLDAQSVATDERCRLPPERGQCKGHFDAYAFDPGAQACNRFVWGGCGSEPFAAKEDCEKVCKPQ